jgi:excinuclease ABC subunit B
MDRFKLVSDFKPAGDQPRAIGELVEGLRNGMDHQTLLGVTGSGKTFTIANVVEQVNRPTLVMAPNKILAAQLYSEFKNFFPENAVEYFVSYYDYYQPEAYVPSRDLFIEKDSSVNDEIDKMRHSATRAVLTRRDCIIVASVSCIYGIGSPEMYEAMRVELYVGEEFSREKLIAGLVAMQYNRNDIDFHRGTFRVRGDIVDVFPAYEADIAVRIEYFGDEIESINEIDPLRGQTIRKTGHTSIYPGTHYATTSDNLQRAIKGIREEMKERLSEFRNEGNEICAQRLEQRTRYDLEMLTEIGFCPGVENYSRHLDGRQPEEAPYTLFSYLPDDFLLVVDESHIAVPQFGAMFKGDRARKNTLVDFGFRLPCARDNRPLKFEEWEGGVNQVIYCSATPRDYELEKSQGLIVEQVVRPTGLIDPEVEIRPADAQVDDLLGEIRNRVEKAERVLVGTLTKRMAEDLTEYYRDVGIQVRYMHSDVDTLERIELIRALRAREYDVLVGINLLREGLDIPEVSLVAVLDADKEGYLRSESSLIQTSGRAARNANGKVIMYANSVTKSMEAALGEMTRRREKQQAFNEEHNITPKTIKKAVAEREGIAYEADQRKKKAAKVAEETGDYMTGQDINKSINKLKKKMKEAADVMNFEEAAEYRDRLLALEHRQIEEGW